MSKPSTNTAAREAIRAMLDARAATDAQFAAAYATPGKSIGGCFDYILKIARKRGSAVCMTDAEVLGLAVHYYDEIDATLAAEAPGAAPIAEVAVAAAAPQPAPAPSTQTRRKKKQKDNDPLSPMLFDPDEL